MIGVSLLVFPRLALGLSGFETGVSMLPLVRGNPEDDPVRPEGRIRNTRKMLTVAALIISFFLLTTTFVTAVLIPLAALLLQLDARQPPRVPVQLRPLRGG